MTSSLTIRAHGHPSVRASHGKTLELTPDDSLGAGGTCVLGVGATAAGAPPAGAVRVRITVGRWSVEFGAVGNPEWETSGPAVVRRSDQQRADTVASHAELAAADLPREVAAALQDPATEIVVELHRAEVQPDLVVLLGNGASAAIVQAQQAGADAVWPTDRRSGRLLVIGSELPAELRLLSRLEVHGLAPQQAVAAAAPGATVAELAALSDEQHRGDALVLRVPAAEVPRVVRAAARHGRSTGALLARLPWVQLGALADMRVPAGARTLWLCLDPAPIASDQALLAAIAAARVSADSTKQLARDIAAQFGVPVSRVYDLAVRAPR